ncbi:uncharacterized protein LOC123893192 [Trifolium pratense]|uniref:uncharacterized protein LOC123893192 n=1 Tax=Trifolium pratense TaxID=57577 RepID=UPI001E691A12|nr:uncharacterized protein LOC123893192 [Trifolium pratense]
MSPKHALPKRSCPVAVNWLPHFIQEYFVDIIDVVGDRHYGFRVVSRLLGKSPNGHNIICLEFTIELNKNRAQHLDIFGSQQRNDVIKNALKPAGTDVAHEDKCMMMHDIGFLLAQKYKHVVVLLAGNKGFSKMYFPLEGDPTSKERLVCLGWVNGNHFLVIHSYRLLRHPQKIVVDIEENIIPETVDLSEDLCDRYA